MSQRTLFSGSDSEYQIIRDDEKTNNQKRQVLLDDDDEYSDASDGSEEHEVGAPEAKKPDPRATETKIKKIENKKSDSTLIDLEPEIIERDRENFRAFASSNHPSGNIQDKKEKKKEPWTYYFTTTKFLFGNAKKRLEWKNWGAAKFHNLLTWCGWYDYSALPSHYDEDAFLQDEEINDDKIKDQTSSEQCCGVSKSALTVIVSAVVNIPGTLLSLNSVDKNYSLEKIMNNFSAFWLAINSQQKYEALVKPIAYFGVNTLLNSLYFPEATQKARDNWNEIETIMNAKDENGKPKYSAQYRAWKKTKLIISSIFALAGAVSSAGMAYMSSLWAGTGLGGILYRIFAIPSSYLAFVLIRFVGTHNILTVGERIILWFFQEIRTLLNILDRLKYADKETQKQLEEELIETFHQKYFRSDNKPKEKLQELTEAEFEKVSLEFFQKIKEQIEQGDINLSQEKPTPTSVYEFAFLISSLFAAGYLSYETALVFIQTTINGLNATAKALGAKEGIEPWGKPGRLTAGIFGAISSFNTYLDAIRKLPYTMFNTLAHLFDTIGENGILSWEFVKEGGALVLIGFFNYYAGFGLAGTAKSIEKNPNDVGLKTDANGDFIATSAGIGAASVNVNSNLNRLAGWLKKEENLTLLQQFINRWEEYEKRQPNANIVEEMKAIISAAKQFADDAKKENQKPATPSRSRFSLFSCCDGSKEEKESLLSTNTQVPAYTV